jgi:hypothetical protein
MAYSSGKKALGICDRCGFTYKLSELRYEIEDDSRNGFRVCYDCFDVDHPQLRIGDIETSDNVSLYDPRIDSGEKESTEYFGFNPVNSTGMVMRNEVGQVTITTGETSSISTDITGLEGTASVGTVTLTGIDDTAAVTGVAGTSALGSVSASGDTVYTVTVASYLGGNRYYIDSVVYPTLTLNEGSTYRFDQSDSSNSGHPLRFSTTANGTHGGGSEYTTGVTTNGTPGSSGAYTQITVAVGAPTLYYYCTNHSGMGGTANTP